MENALYRFSNRYRRPDIYNDVSKLENDVVVYQKNKVNYSLSALIKCKKVINKINYTREDKFNCLFYKD